MFLCEILLFPEMFNFMSTEAFVLTPLTPLTSPKTTKSPLCYFRKAAILFMGMPKLKLSVPLSFAKLTATNRPLL